MKQLLFLLSACVLLISCDYTSGSGNIITDTRAVGNFNSISVSSSFDVEVKIGPAAAIRVEADDNIMKYIVTNVSGNELRIKMEGMHSLNNVHMKVFITTPSLIRINADASATVKVLDIIKSTI